MKTKAFIVIIAEPTPAHNEDKDFTLISAKQIVMASIFNLSDDDMDFKVASEIKPINYDILEGLDNTIGGCLIRTTETKAGTYYTRFDNADVDMISRFLSHIKTLKVREDEMSILDAVIQNHRGKKVNELIK
jgi:hypothetical protein